MPTSASRPSTPSEWRSTRPAPDLRWPRARSASSGDPVVAVRGRDGRPGRGRRRGGRWSTTSPFPPWSTPRRRWPPARRCSSTSWARTWPRVSATPTTATCSTGPTSSCADASSTSASRSCRWRATPSRSSPATSPQLTVYVSTQMPHLFRTLACRLLDIAEDELRVIAPHVGGGFGGKAGITAEHAWPSAAARRLGRPVTWVETRSENLVALPHGRSQVQYVEMGFTRDGHITGMHAARRRGRRRVRRLRRRAVDGPDPHHGPRRVPHPEARPSTWPWPSPTRHRWVRSAGPAGPRRRPFSSASWTSPPTSSAIDPGRSPPPQPPALRRVPLHDADRHDVRQRRLRAPARPGRRGGRLHGAAGRAGGPQGGGRSLAARHRRQHLRGGHGRRSRAASTARSRCTRTAPSPSAPERRPTARATPTSFAMIVADRLGIPMTDIRYVQSDTALVPRGGGTGGSRSLQIGGTRRAHRRRRGARQGPAHRRPRCWKPTRPTSC